MTNGAKANDWGCRVNHAKELCATISEMLSAIRQIWHWSNEMKKMFRKSHCLSGIRKFLLQNHDIAKTLQLSFLVYTDDIHTKYTDIENLTRTKRANKTHN